MSEYKKLKSSGLGRGRPKLSAAEKEARAELVNFVDNLTIEQFEKIANFFVTMPKIEKRIDYKCPKCEEDNFILIDGVESFFE